LQSIGEWPQGNPQSPPSRGRLLAAYRHRIFPECKEAQPIFWGSPDPRTVPAGLFLASVMEASAFNSGAMANAPIG